MELQLRNLSKQYGTKCAVDNVNAKLEPGVYGLLGANGAGKTTLMRMICGVLKPTSGDIRLNGKTINEPWRAVLYSFRLYAAGFWFLP